jgi:hypothetical protein
MGGACSTYGEKRSVYSVLWGKPKEKYQFEDTSIDGRMILRRIFRKWDRGACAGLIWLRIGIGGGNL